MTSNVGFVNNSIGFNSKNNGNINEYFDMPLINRIDNIIRFNSLTYDNVKEIVKNNIKELNKKYKKRQINIKISNNIIEEIIKISNYNDFGARKIEKIIKNDLESLIINEIIDNKKNIFIKNLKKEEAIL